MGVNTLATATDGTVIPAADHNSLVTALKDTFAPRDTTTLAATDLAGDLGTTSYRWDNAYIKKLILGAISSSLSIEEDGSNRMILKVGGSTALTLDSGGLIPDSIVTDMVTDLNITRAKQASSPYAISSSSGTYSLQGTASPPWTAVTNLSATITATGRPVLIGLISDGNAGGLGSDSVLSIVSTGGSDFDGQYRFVRSGTSLGHTSLRTSETSGAPTDEGVTLPFTIDVPSAGSKTYTFEIKSGTSTADYIYCRYLKLVAYEL